MRDAFVCHNPEQKYLNKLLRYVNETRQLLSSKMKPERERMVCRAFLRCMGLPFREDQIIVSTDEPPDIIFDSTRFEIRELLDDGRRRGDEWAQEARKVERAEDIEAVSRPTPSPRQISLEELIPLVADALREKCTRYGAECGRLDALVYVNLRERFLSPYSTTMSVEDLEAQGWRSVSMVFIPYAVVMTANSTAPDFLRKRVGQIANAWPEPEGWFEP
jgi:putative endonuclease (uncharacterized protein DUF1780)